MAVGWARDGAVQEQIDASVADAVDRARNNMGKLKRRQIYFPRTYIFLGRDVPGTVYLISALFYTTTAI